MTRKPGAFAATLKKILMITNINNVFTPVHPDHLKYSFLSVFKPETRSQNDKELP